MRVLGVDWGTKRIGIAVGDTQFRIATARRRIPASGKLREDALAILELARLEQAEAVVIGIPRYDEDAPNPVARVGTKLAECLEELGMKVYKVDEALSSVEAERQLRDSRPKAAGRCHARDSQAAAVILERFFHEEGASA